MKNTDTGINKVLTDIGRGSDQFRRDEKLLREMLMSQTSIDRIIANLERLPMCKKQAE